MHTDALAVRADLYRKKCFKCFPSADVHAGQEGAFEVVLFKPPHSPFGGAAAWPGREVLQQGSNTCHRIFSGPGLLHLVIATEALNVL